MRLKFNRFQLIFIILSLIALVSYVLHPDKYDYAYNLYCMLQYLGSVVLFLIFKKKKNYFDFDVLFLTTSFFAFFVYPVFIYPIDPIYFNAFRIGNYHSEISQSTSMALLGLEVYMTGSLCYKVKSNRKFITVNYYPLMRFTCITIAIFVLFIAVGGYDFYKNMYTKEHAMQGGIVTYIAVLVCIFIIVTLCLQFSNLRLNLLTNNLKHGLNLPFVIFIFCYLIIMLSTGSRTVPLQVVLVTIGLWSIFFKPMSLKVTLLLMLLGSIGLFLISMVRMQQEGELTHFYDPFMDIIIVNRNTFGAIDYVNRNGFTYGYSLLSNLLQPIPFAQSIVFDVFNINPLYASSSQLFTTEAFGASRSYGLGTNIIADLYLAFGPIGLIACMFFGGWIVAKSEYLARFDIKYMVIYAVLISNSVYLVRASFFFCLQQIIWCLIIILCFSKPLYVKKYPLSINMPLK